MVGSEDYKDKVRIFVGYVDGPDEFVGFFEDDNEKGCLYISDRRAERIIKHLQVYDNSKVVRVEAGDVEVLWSTDGKKCGITIWGRMRAVIDIGQEKTLFVPLENRHGPAITDPLWLNGFEHYIDQEQFVRARQRYWKQMIGRHDLGAQIRSEDQSPVETNFILHAKGPSDQFAVFEDEGATGYLYLYSSTDQKILRHLHVYDRSERIDVTPQDIEVVWASGKPKLGVVIWEKMRGIIDLAKERPGRVWLESQDTPGIADKEWLEGFRPT